MKNRLGVRPNNSSVRNSILGIFMKKLFPLILSFCGFALSCEIMSELDYPAMEVNLFEENELNLDNLKSCSDCKWLRKEENYFLYRASSDSSVVVYLNSGEIKFFKICESPEVCDDLKEIFDFSSILQVELRALKNQKAFENEFDIDSLSEHILEVMKLASYNHVALSGLSYNHGKAESDGEDSDSAEEALTERMFCRGFCGFLDTLQLCPELVTSLTPFFVPNGHGMSAVKIRNGEYRIGGLRKTELFRLYDLNGNFLSGGTLRNGIFQVKHEPVILVVLNTSFLLK